MIHLFVPKNDILRHRILKIISEAAISKPRQYVTEEEIAVPLSIIAKQLNETEEKIQHAALGLANNEADFRYYSGKLHLAASEETLNVYSTNKYLRQGRTHVLTRIKDYLGITTAIIAIVTSIIALVTAFISLTNNQSRIEALEKEVHQLKSQDK